MSYTAFHLPMANEFPQEVPKLLAPTDNLQLAAMPTIPAEQSHCQLALSWMRTQEWSQQSHVHGLVLVHHALPHRPRMELVVAVHHPLNQPQIGQHQVRHRSPEV